MVDAMILGAGLGVMASLVQEGVVKLVKRFKEVKGTDAETRELEEFIDYVKKNENMYTSSSNEVRTMLRESLDKAKRKLKEWSSKKSGFLARSSSERVQEVQALRRSVESAISMAHFRLTNNIHTELILAIQQNKEILKVVKNLPLKPKGTTSAQEAPRGRGETIKKKPSESTAKLKFISVTVPSTGPSTRSKTTQPSSGGKGQHNSTGQQSSTSAHGGRKRPALSPQPHGISKSIEELSLEASSSTKPPKSGATAGSALRTGKLTNSDSKKRRVDLWQELWVSIDSEKQANDIKERLLGLEGVKEVHLDQPSQKVSVLLREGSNISKLTKALIENAQLKDKRKPTPWAERPR